MKSPACRLASSPWVGVVFRVTACLLCAAAAWPGTIAAQDSGKSRGVDGYWQLIAALPDYNLTTNVRFRTAPDGETVEGVVLGPTSGRPGAFTARLSGNHLSSTVPGPLGDMRVDLTLSTDTFAGTWAAGDLHGSVTAVRKPARKPEPDYYAKFFKTVCDVLRDKFYDPRLNGADLEKLRAKYALHLADLRDDGDFVTMVRRLVGEFGTSHTDFFLQPDVAPLKERNPAILSRPLSPGVSYLRIGRFESPSAQDREAFSQAMNEAMENVADARSLIVDLRGNRGGNVAVVFRSLGYFLSAGQDVAYVAGRKGFGAFASFPGRTGSVPAGMAVVKSSNNAMFAEVFRAGAAVIRTDSDERRPYRGKTAALIDEGCYSACELFAAILRDRAGAVLVGSRTAGEVLGSEVYSIVKNMVVTKADTGWRLEVPIFDFRTMRGERMEGNGVKPDIEVAKGGTGDVVLSAALKYLERQ